MQVRKYSKPAMRALQACNVYVSEGKNGGVLTQLQNLAESQPDVVLVNTWIDQPYNRTGYTLVAAIPEKLTHAAVALAKAAIEKLDLRDHVASHPRLGVVDHISCHPLNAAAELKDAAAIARSIGNGIGNGKYAAPVYLYGDASQDKAKLADIRRRLGYFSGAAAGTWQGHTKLSVGAPDMGPSQVDPAAGVVLVGAVAWVTNYNIQLESSDLHLARQIAYNVSERGGGIAAVQAMALPYGKDMEIACNLLLQDEALIDKVLSHVKKQASLKGVRVVDAYRIGTSTAEYEKSALKKLESQA